MIWVNILEALAAEGEKHMKLIIQSFLGTALIALLLATAAAAAAVTITQPSMPVITLPNVPVITQPNPPVTTQPSAPVITQPNVLPPPADSGIGPQSPPSGYVTPGIQPNPSQVNPAPPVIDNRQPAAAPIDGVHGNIVVPQF